MFQKKMNFWKRRIFSLSSKLNDICEGNKSLKNKITLVEKEKDIILDENNSSKRKIVLRKGKYFLKKD